MTATDSTPAVDNRRKVDPDQVLKLRAEGTTALKIATEGLASNGTPVAVGTIYKILREHGQGSGRTIGSRPKGMNVSSELTATHDRLKAQVDSADEQIKAENERHKSTLENIESNAKNAREALKGLEALMKNLTPEPDGDGESKDAKEGAKEGKSK